MGLTVVIGVWGIGTFTLALWLQGWPDFWFRDLDVLREATERLFGGGSWFLDRQLHGPYERAFGEILYPPVIAWLIVPWTVLPQWTFLVPPIAIVSWHLTEARPRAWTWPLIAFGLTYPITLVHAAYGNPSLWIAAFVALGLRFGWPGALVLLKPSFLPFALIGIGTLRWWLCAALLGVASFPFITDTFAYPRVLLDWRGGNPLYSLQSVPLLLVPLVAWIGRRR